MSHRILLDAHLSPKKIGKPLQKKGHEVLSLASHPELEGMSDQQVLELAAEQHRILVTCDAKDFAPMAAAWAGSGSDHTGLILVWTVPNDAYREIIRGVHRILQHHTPADWTGMCEVL